MSYRLVTQPNHAPGFCLASGRAQDPEGFIDCGMGVAFHAPYSYISVGALRDMAGLVGMVPADHHADLASQLDDARARIAELEAEVDELRQLEENVKYTLNHFDVPLRVKPGPKGPRPKAEA